MSIRWAFPPALNLKRTFVGPSLLPLAVLSGIAGAGAGFICGLFRLLLGEADRLVSFLGRASGRMRGVAAGARRLKNRYGSTLELLSHVQIWYVERETRDLVRIQQTELLESFHKAQSDYSLSTGLALVSEIAELVLPEHETNEAMFRLILLTTRDVERRNSSALPLSYFAFWTVRLAGWLPRFDACASCGKPFEKGTAYQSPSFLGLLDERHRRGGMKPLSYETRDRKSVV